MGVGGSADVVPHLTRRHGEHHTLEGQQTSRYYVTQLTAVVSHLLQEEGDNTQRK